MVRRVPVLSPLLALPLEVTRFAVNSGEFGHLARPCAHWGLASAAVDELNDALEEIDGDRTPVDCLNSGECFPFRECRLFVLEIEGQNEHLFFCDACHEERVREPFRKMADERGLTAKAWAALEEAARSEDLAVRAEAVATLIRYKALERGGPPAPESN
jgi:hypothetical protein